MNFLYRTAQPVPELQRIPESEDDNDVIQKPATTLEGLIADDLYNASASVEYGATNNDGINDMGGDAVRLDSKSSVPSGKHTDVSGDEGWITIPYKELPENWNGVSDILELQPLDRSFLFPGEQIHILVCLSASKQDTQIITPFRVAAVMSNVANKSSSVSENGDANVTCGENGCQKAENNGQSVESNGEILPEDASKQDISETESLLRMEYHKKQTENILQRFRNSYFFVRIAESDEPLWSKKKLTAIKMAEEQSYSDDQGNCKVSRSNVHNVISDKGVFDGTTSGGLARDAVQCYALQNGDIVVVLRVNIGVNNLKDPVLEVLQFEKCLSSNCLPENLIDKLSDSNEDPYQELLTWLLPLDRTLPSRTLSPSLNPTVSYKQSNSAPASQIFSFGNFRSYSMPSIAQSAPPSSVHHPNIRSPPSESQEFDNLMMEKPAKTPENINEWQLSFRGVPLEPERYSVRCGLEGLYLPGRRWWRKVEIIQPIEVHSFSAKSTADNLLCVLVKNITPHLKDIVVFIDAITIVFEEASKGSAPLPIPIASIEVGHGFNLPNLALRSGEEHSFILKPATMSSRDKRTKNDVNPALSLMKIGERRGGPVTDQYAVLVSYHCNYTESKLFFKQATSWRPRVASDLMISVSSELSLQNSSPSARVPQLPVQVLTLEATNLTAENLTLTVLAPEASGSSSILSLNSTPRTPHCSYGGPNEPAGRASIQRLNSFLAGSMKEKDNGGNRITAASGCTHLWLQSAVPLGCVPAHSTTKVKLELLPLKDGIITLDTLQISIREKGITYIPEHSLEIYATSGVSSGI